MRRDGQPKQALSRGEALGAAGRLETETGMRFTPYRCPVCRHWHVGRSRAAETRRVVGPAGLIARRDDLEVELGLRALAHLARESVGDERHRVGAVTDRARRARARATPAEATR